MFSWIAILLVWIPQAGAEDLRVAALSEEGTNVTDLAVDSTGRWVGFVEKSSGAARVLDTETWEVDDFSPCSSSSVTGVAFWEDETTRLYCGCANGTVTYLELDEDEEAFSQSGSSVTLEDAGGVLGVGANTDFVYAVAEQEEDDGNPRVHIVDPTSDEADEEDGYPSTLGYSSFADVEVGSSTLSITHSSDNVSKVDLATGSAVQADSSLGSVSSTDLIYNSGGSVLIAAENRVVHFSTSDNDLTSVIDEDDGIEEVTALWLDDAEGSLWAADAGRGEFVEFTYNSTNGEPGDEEQSSFGFPDESSASVSVNEVVVWDGYSVAGTSDGELWIVTDRPWVEIDAIGSEVFTSGDEVELTFVSDMDGDFDLVLDPYDSDTVLTSGVVVADEATVATFAVDDDYVEGANLIRIEVTGDDEAGHDAVVIDVDNPPEQVDLDLGSVGFGNAQISVSFDGIDAEDLDYYVIYLTVTPFNGDDWDSGGPSFDGSDNVTTPVTVSAAPSANVDENISPLTNGVTYYVAVRAVDTAGQEGPMSDVMCATPNETYSVSSLTGDTGGLCGLARATGGAVALFAGVAAAFRRRRTWMGALAFGLISGLVSTDAWAGNGDKDKGPFASRGAIQLRYGPVWFLDEDVVDVFGESGHSMLWLEMGRSIGEFVEFSGGVGYLSAEGSLVDENGKSSSESDCLHVLPFSGNITLRGDFVHEWPLVPYTSVGGDYWLWRESWEVNPDVGGADTVTGGKPGWHWAAGVQFLLDVLEPKRASKLEAGTGIRDTYVVAEYRQQNIGDGEGLVLNSDLLSFGLKFNY